MGANPVTNWGEQEAVNLAQSRLTLRVPIVCCRYGQKTSRSSSSFQLWIVAMGSARIAPTAAPSASERSSESRLRLVRGLVMSPPLHVPYFGRAEKEYRNRCVVRLQVLGLGCRPSRPARLPRFSPRVLNRVEAPSPPWVPPPGLQRLRRAHSAPCKATEPPRRTDKRGWAKCVQICC